MSVTTVADEECCWSTFVSSSRAARSAGARSAGRTGEGGGRVLEQGGLRRGVCRVRLDETVTSLRPWPLHGEDRRGRRRSPAAPPAPLHAAVAVRTARDRGDRPAHRLVAGQPRRGGEAPPTSCPSDTGAVPAADASGRCRVSRSPAPCSGRRQVGCAGRPGPDGGAAGPGRPPSAPLFRAPPTTGANGARATTSGPPAASGGRGADGCRVRREAAAFPALPWMASRPPAGRARPQEPTAGAGPPAYGPVCPP